jgi:hypothetical protein
MDLPTPAIALIHLSSGFLQANPQVHIQHGSRHEPIEPGWHFGSAYADLSCTRAVYDFLPDTLLHKVANRSAFAGALVFDKWTANTDSRQAVFLRDSLPAALALYPREASPTRYVAVLIDHGAVFHGSRWTFIDSPSFGLYFRPSVYSCILAWGDLEPWLLLVSSCPESVVHRCVAQLPDNWLKRDNDSLERLMEVLFKRRARVSGLVEETMQANPQLFPHWPA